MTIKIVTDSTCDLPVEVAAQWGITVVPVYINMDGKSYQDGVDLSRSDFYEKLPSAHPLPTTSSPGIDAFVKVFRELYDAGAEHIISIHISQTLSNIGNVANLAAEALQEEGVPVTVFDSGQLTLGLGLLVLEAAQKAATGANKDEVMQTLEQMAKRTYSFALLDTLEYLKRGGRISFLQHNVATLFSIKPLLIMHGGDLKMERIRTHKRAVQRMLEMVRNLGALEKVALIHAHAIERLDGLRSAAGDLLRDIELPFSGEVTSAIGAHVGTGSIGLVCVLKPTNG